MEETQIIIITMPNFVTQYIYIYIYLHHLTNFPVKYIILSQDSIIDYIFTDFFYYYHYSV